MNRKFKNWCIKEINGQFYIYSWCYRPKAYRTIKRNARFYWKYRGRYGSLQVNKFLKTFTPKEQQEVYKEYSQLLELRKQQQGIIQQLECKEPFRTEKETILQIRNRQVRMNALQVFYKKLKLEAYKQITASTEAN